MDEIVEWTGITFDDASRSDGEGMVQGMSDVRETTLRDFVLFCFERRPVPWPTLYDEMCYVAGHRLSTGAMEEVLAAHPDIAECAVVGVADEIKGEVPLGFVVTKAGVARGEAEIVRELVEKVREQIGPVAAFKTALVVKRLPKTRSGKILRGTMKRIADGQEYTAPATIDDPAILAEITEALGAKGYPKRF